MLLAAVALGLLSGCGGSDPFPAACTDRPEVRPRAADEARANFASLRLTDLGAGWKSVRPDQPLDILRPSLGDLVETARTSSPIFTRDGTVVRSSTTLFASGVRPVDLDLYAECLAGRFNTDQVQVAARRRVDLAVPRPTGEGSDSVSVFPITSGRALLVFEIVTGGSLNERFVERVLLRVTTRLRRAAG